MALDLFVLIKRLSGGLFGVAVISTFGVFARSDLKSGVGSFQHLKSKKLLSPEKGKTSFRSSRALFTKPRS